MNTSNRYKNNSSRHLTLAALLALTLSTGAYAASGDDELEVTMEIISATSEIDAFEMQLPPADAAAASTTSLGAFVPFGASVPTAVATSNPPADDDRDHRNHDRDEIRDEFEHDLRDEESFERDHAEFDDRDADDEMEEIDDREDVREDEEASDADDFADESDDVFDDESDEMSDEIADEMSDEIADEMSDEMSDQIADEMSDEISDALAEVDESAAAEEDMDAVDAGSDGE